MEAWNIDAETLNDRLKALKPQLHNRGGEDMGPASRLMQKTRAEMLTEMLEHKFGALPKGVQGQLEQASLEDLATWGKATLDAASLEAVFGGASGEARR